MSSTIAMPQVISAYVDATNSKDDEQLLSLFASNATVRDEGKTYRGLSEISDWRMHVTKSYEFKLQVLDVVEKGGEIVVSTRMSGNFPGKNPVNIKHFFELNGNRIARLYHE